LSKGGFLWNVPGANIGKEPVLAFSPRMSRCWGFGSLLPSGRTLVPASFLWLLMPGVLSMGPPKNIDCPEYVSLSEGCPDGIAEDEALPGATLLAWLLGSPLGFAKNRGFLVGTSTPVPILVCAGTDTYRPAS